MRVLTSQQMRDADRRTTEEIGIPSLVLMENAGRQVVASMEATFQDLSNLHVAILCGKGNNGGDGFVAARVLAERGIDISVFLVGVSADVRGDARVNLGALRALDIDVVEIADAATWELHGSDVLAADVIVDAIFGTGLKEPVTGLVETIIADLNACPRPVVAVDLPSGLSADSAEVIGPAVAAALTVTLGAPKVALVLPPAERHAGSLVIADIGIPESIIENLDGPWLELITKTRMATLVTPRVPESQKGDYGRILIVAGSKGKTGAAHLAAAGALRSGAGLVTVATPASCQPILATLGVEYMTLALEETSEGQAAWEALDRILDTDADVIALGPGLGRAPSTMALVQAVVERAGVPLVLDADALFAFVGESDRLLGREDAEVIITPHPGEMARLTGLTVEAVQANRVEVARTFAVNHRLHVVLKGHRTVVATPDGKAYINLTGNPGMASGGTGDVLTGIVAAWFAQLLDTSDAAQLAVYLHGLAGDLAAADEGEVAMVAGDLVDRLGDAVLELTSTRRRKPGESSGE
jgi:hydroxyethylthiazole kinase-like uncharacterized protein yjeF